MSAPTLHGIPTGQSGDHRAADGDAAGNHSADDASARNGWRLWSRADLRDRWRSLVVLGLLAGLAVGVALAAFDGARRTDTALARLRAATNASDAVVFPSQVGVPNPDFTKLSQEPEVKKVAPWGLVDGSINGGPSDVLFMPIGTTWMGDVDKPVVVSGRMFDPEAPDEMVISEDSVTEDHVHVGDILHFQAEGSESDETTGTLTGPKVDIRIVGVVRIAGNFLFTGGMGVISPAFGTHLSGSIIVYENAFVQLRHGSADVPQLLKDANDDVAPGTPVLDEHATARRVSTTTDVEHTMLMLLALVVLLAGGVLVGQALIRSSSTIATDAPTLRAMGMTRSDLISAGLVPHALVVAVAVCVTATTAVVASQWMPVGLAARIDPDRGVQMDGLLTVLGCAALALLAVVTVTVAAAAATRASEVSRPKARRGLFAATRRLRPVTVGLGTTMALEPGSAKSSAPSRTALIGAVAAVAGIVGALTVDHGLHYAVSHPELAGVAWQAIVVPDTESAFIGDAGTRTAARVTAEPSVVAASFVRRAVFAVDGLGVPTFSGARAGSAKPPIEFVLIDGRRPQSPNEIALGPKTAALLHVSIGDTVSLADHASAVVVGHALFPSDVHSEFDEGALVTPESFSAILAAEDPKGDNSAEEGIAVDFVAGSDPAHAIDALSADVGGTGNTVEPPETPPELVNLANVTTLPALLAAFLALLGTAAIGHVLHSSVRRRSRDFAVYRTLGVTRRGSRAILNAHGSTVALFGLVIGVPAGLIAGRYAWKSIAATVPLRFVTPVTLTSAIVLVPAAIVAANVLAVLPGRRAARLKPAEVLRSE